MAVHVHYGGATYVEVEHDLDDTISRITRTLNSELGAGIIRVTTKTGTVDLFISRNIPVAVEHVESASTQVPRRIR